MENKKAQVGSASSLTSQLFGSQGSSSSNDVFASIFPSPKGVGRNSGPWQESTGTGNQPWNTRQDNTYKPGDATYSTSGCKDRNSIYPQEGAEPCYLSSSLYYGGQETYSSKSTTHSTPSSYPTFKKDGGEDDSNVAARGNWWQGSLYY